MLKPDGQTSSTDSLWTGELSELELVKKIVNDDSSSYSLVLKQFQDLTYRMLLRQTGDAEIASDLAQETFIRAYEKLSTFKGESSLSTWITRIALNLANNYFSSKEYKARKKTTESICLNQFSEADSTNFEERLVMLREFISELKPKQRNVLVLCSLEKKSYEEAAAILKIPVGTVRSRLHEARLVLRNRFLAEASDL